MTDFIDLMTLETVAPLCFMARHGQVNRNGTVYGGQLLGHLARAAELTVPNTRRRLHTLHATFERAATTTTPIEYVVEPALDGGSETVRRIRSLQNGQILITANAGFGPAFTGFAHSVAWQAAPPMPESLPTLVESSGLLESLLTVHGKSRVRTYPHVQIRPLNPRRHLLVDSGPSQSRFWIRVLSKAVAPELSHSAVIAYLSDYLAVNAALAGHVNDLPDESLFVASLNHSLWIYETVDPEQWVFCEWDSPWAGGGRTLCTGKFFDVAGRLVATAAQMIMLRPRRRE
jgi:acyl-CoA thioesterase-2